MQAQIVRINPVSFAHLSHRIGRVRLLSAMAAVVVLAMGSAAHGTTYEWTGTQSSAWENAANWDCNGACSDYPGQSASAVVIVPSATGAGASPWLSTTLSNPIQSLTIEGGTGDHGVDVIGGELTVDGDLVVEGGHLFISGITGSPAEVHIEGDVIIDADANGRGTIALSSQSSQDSATLIIDGALTVRGDLLLGLLSHVDANGTVTIESAATHAGGLIELGFDDDSLLSVGDALAIEHGNNVGVLKIGNGSQVANPTVELLDAGPHAIAGAIELHDATSKLLITETMTFGPDVSNNRGTVTGTHGSAEILIAVGEKLTSEIVIQGQMKIGRIVQTLAAEFENLHIVRADSSGGLLQLVRGVSWSDASGSLWEADGSGAVLYLAAGTLNSEADFRVNNCGILRFRNDVTTTGMFIDDGGVIQLTLEDTCFEADSFMTCSCYDMSDCDGCDP